MDIDLVTFKYIPNWIWEQYKWERKVWGSSLKGAPLIQTQPVAIHVTRVIKNLIEYDNNERQKMIFNRTIELFLIHCVKILKKKKRVLIAILGDFLS